MHFLDKFFSDLQIAAKGEQPLDAIRLTFLRSVSSYDKSLTPIANDLIEYNITEHVHDNTEKTIQWFYQVFAFLTNSFEETMDFSEDDWNELRLAIESVQDSIDIETLSSYMSVFLDRKVI